LRLKSRGKSIKQHLPMADATFQTFEAELSRLVAKFERGLGEFKHPGYLEAQLRDDFLSPLFSALGWDLKNDAGLIQSHREVEIESRTGSGRADYLFRPDRKPRFVCEAKKPAEELHGGHAMQAKRYAWTIGVRLAALSDFEELKIYIVTGNPDKGKPDDGLWRSYHYTEFVGKARELWELLARDNVAGGSIERALGSLPKNLRPDPKRDFDEEFLVFLDGHRRALASDLIRHNDRKDLLEGTRLNEAVQCILDRLLFIRISEARGIDMGTKLQSLLETWMRRQERQDKADSLREEPPAGWGGAGLGAPRGSLWNSIVRHIRALDRRPPSHVPFFNGNLFKQHFSEELVVGDVWLSEFLGAISDEKSSYKFAYVAVEILGTIYERFLGKIVRPHGRGAVIEEKPEVRKAGGVYYTPRYIVEYIVEQTVGKLLEGKKPEETLKLGFLDPACGSGSFLLRVFERVCEHWQQWLVDHPGQRKKDWCWMEEKANTLHLTARLKRRILRETIYGVDLDPQAVEVTQLSLYLKMLEGETSETLQREQDLFGGEEPILPPLQDNIKCGNSLIASDFSLVPEDLVRVHAFDWPVQFPTIMKAGGFDAVVGNPPYLYSAGQEAIDYFNQRYRLSEYQTDFYTYFIEKALGLVRRAGRFAFVVSDSWLKAENFSRLRNHLLQEHRINRLAVFDFPPFAGATIENSILVTTARAEPADIPIDRFSGPGVFAQCNVLRPADAVARELIDPRHSSTADELVRKLEAGSVPLESLMEMNRGIHAYRTDGYGKSKFGSGPQTKRDKETQSYHAKKPLNKSFLPELKGKDVFRFEFVPTGDFLSYGPWLAEPRDPNFFLRPKITVRKVLGHKLHGTFIAEPMALDQSLYVLISPSDDAGQLKFVLGILLSGIGAWYLRTKFAIYDTLYPWYTKKQFGLFPIKGHSQKLVGLVDKMLALSPKLRAAKTDAERQTLQNAVTATDQQIDGLVYELYGLTKAEIALVEGGEK
jgi:hypothetical protein